ncbi:MAG: acylphosphatase [Planctomycetota bacterium]
MTARSTTIARRLRYEGRVQGVGFRATVCELARPRGVAGEVRNEPDGSVRLDAEGSAPSVADLLRAIRERFGANITREQIDDATPRGLQQLTIVRP